VPTIGLAVVLLIKVKTCPEVSVLFPLGRRENLAPLLRPLASRSGALGYLAGSALTTGDNNVSERLESITSPVRLIENR